MKRFTQWALTPFRRWASRTSSEGDPWERLPYAAPVKSFGRGSVHPFPWYFEGESAVTVTGVDDVCEWLAKCRYVRDPDLFNESDFWQHPRTFERLREGDCEDHALWAWRKLVELGYEAELMSGTWNHSSGEEGGHVWVRYRADGREWILEAVGGTRDRMVRAFDEARDDYIPHAGVDRRFQLHAYLGCLRGAARR